MKVIEFRRLDAGGKAVGDIGERFAVGAVDRTVRIDMRPEGNRVGNFDGVIYSGACNPAAPGGIGWKRAPGRTGRESWAMSIADGRPAVFRRDDARKSGEARGAKGMIGRARQ